MDDADQLHSTLALVARGVQRMADSFGAIEQRLERLESAVAVGSAPADDGRVGRLVEAVRGLRDDLAIATTQIEAKIAERPEPAVPAPAEPASVEVDRLVDAVRALRDDLAAATARLQAETTATVERTANDHGTRLAQLRDSIIEMRDAIPVELVTPPSVPDLASRFDAIDAAVAAIRDDIAAATAPLEGQDPLEPRLLAIESAVTHLRDDLAIDRLESSMRQMGGELERVSSDTSGLRNDVRAVMHEVKAIDDRLGGMSDDLRLVRGLRDGLEALSSGVDAVRVLASKGATSQQMGELGRDLTSLLAEIESARSQVLAVDQQVSQPGAIDVTPAIQRLEQVVGDDVDELGRRIEQLAAAVEAQQHAAATVEDAPPPDVADAIASRLRGLANGARQLGLGISEDVRSRRRRKPAQQR